MIINLMSKNKIIKLRILQYFFENKLKPINLSSLAKKFEISLSTVKRYIKELNDDCLTFCNHPSIITNISKYESQFVSTGSSNDSLYSKLFTNYLESSNTYQLVMLFFKKKIYTIKEMCDMLLLSKTPTYETIKKLNEYLSSYGIKIIKNEQSLYELSGDELAIRIFMFNFLSSSTIEDIWPFPFSKNRIEKRITNLEQQTSRLKNNYLIFNAITLYRIEQSCYLSSANDRLPKISLNFSLFKEVKVIDFDAYFRNSKNKEIEVSTYNLIITCMFTELIDHQEFIHNEKFIHEFKNETYFFYEQFTDTLFNQLNITNKNDYYFTLSYLIIHAELARINTSINYIHLLNCHKDVPLTFELEKDYPWHRPSYKICNNIYEKLAKKTSTKLQSILANDSYTIYINSIASDLTFTFERNNRLATKIYFDFGKDIILKESIINNLYGIYQKSTIIITKDIDSADIIVSDHLHSINSMNHVNIRSMIDIPSVDRLLSMINKNILEKRYKENLDNYL